MDDELRALLKSMGWAEILDINDRGTYTAFVKGSRYFHITADSHSCIEQVAVPTCEGRIVKVVQRRVRSVAFLKQANQNGGHEANRE